jgi:hypothetical protein
MLPSLFLTGASISLRGYGTFCRVTPGAATFPIRDRTPYREGRGRRGSKHRNRVSVPRDASLLPFRALCTHRVGI